LAGLEPDLGVVCDYGEILRPETIAIPQRGMINLHGSLLPKYRGAAPVAWAIYHGELETGNTVFQLAPGVDAGPILSQERLPIDPDETAGELERRLAAAGGPLVVETIHRLAAGAVDPILQDDAVATRAPRLKKEDGKIDWSRSSRAIQNQVRAMQPWPRAHTHWHRPDRPPLRLIVTGAERWSGPTERAEAGPGVIVAATGRLAVATGDGAVAITTLQPAGKRTMSAAEFLRGHDVAVGQRLGP
jgi:methionyl-tRNA formyltransferase